ncbi:hypothetical protein F3D3_1175 [Fusibacter sp. 3D3]|nr:hypothetical protein F3D3_1175 [Fusibacter sp. 3D3]
MCGFSENDLTFVLRFFEIWALKSLFIDRQNEIFQKLNWLQT